MRVFWSNSYAVFCFRSITHHHHHHNHLHLHHHLIFFPSGIGTQYRPRADDLQPEHTVNRRLCQEASLFPYLHTPFFFTVGEESRAQLLQTGGTGRVRDSVWARERQAPSCHLRSCTLIKTATTFAIWSHHELHPAPTTTQPITADMGRKKIQIQRITDERNRQVRSFFFFKLSVCVCVFEFFYYSWH